MTDTAFYDSMDELATALLNAFGRQSTLRRITISEPGADGKATKTPVDNVGLAVKTENKVHLDRLNKEFDAVFVAKFPVEPATNDLIIHAAITWKVEEVAKVSPEGDRLIIAVLGVVKT